MTTRSDGASAAIRSYDVTELVAFVPHKPPGGPPAGSAASYRVVGPTGGLRTYADWFWCRGTRPIALFALSRRIA